MSRVNNGLVLEQLTQGRHVYDVLQIFAANRPAFKLILFALLVTYLFPIILALVIVLHLSFVDDIHNPLVIFGKLDHLRFNLCKLLLCQFCVYDASPAKANPVVERICNHWVLNVELNDELLLRWCVNELTEAHRLDIVDDPGGIIGLHLLLCHLSSNMSLKRYVAENNLSEKI